MHRKKRDCDAFVMDKTMKFIFGLLLLVISSDSNCKSIDRDVAKAINENKEFII